MGRSCLPAGRTILHIDFDSFFASCEQQFNPSLRNKPVGVTAEHGRTCIIAASREAKKYGVKTGTRSWEAKKLIPNIIFVPARFEKYYEITKKLLRICTNYSPTVELFSIDEVFIDLTSTLHLFESAKFLAKDIKEKVRRNIGDYITVTIGVSHNKLLAKLASTINKPNGFGILKKEDIQKVFSNIQMTDICGIGERLKIRLNMMSIYNLIDLQKFPSNILIKEFGPVCASSLKRISLGEDETPVFSYLDSCEVKSIGRNYCLPKNEFNKRIIIQNIYELCEEIGIKLRRIGKKARTVGVSLRGNIDIHGRETYAEYFNSGRDIFYRVLHLIKAQPLSRLNLENQSHYIRQISIWVSSLQDADTLQLSMFDNLQKRQKVIEVIDAINQRFGDHTIRNGFLLYAEKLKTKPNGYMGDRYEKLALTQFETIVTD